MNYHNDDIGRKTPEREAPGRDAPECAGTDEAAGCRRKKTMTRQAAFLGKAGLSFAGRIKANAGAARPPEKG